MRHRLAAAAVLAAGVAFAPAPAPAAAEEVTRDLGAYFPGFRSTLVLRDAEEALAALGVLPAR